jgi:hypothetical protein
LSRKNKEEKSAAKKVLFFFKIWAYTSICYETYIYYYFLYKFKQFTTKRMFKYSQQFAKTSESLF